ncbi:hypothetical protein ACQEUX_10845 [Micromonospora sp. CA-259024]
MKMTPPLRIALAVLLAGGVVATGPPHRPRRHRRTPRSAPAPAR